MIFSYSDIEAAFLAAVFKEALHWFEAGWIHAPNVQRQGALVTASITIGGQRPLRVYIRTNKSAGRVKFHPECTCREAFCKHAAAVLLQALADEGGAEPGAATPAGAVGRVSGQDFLLIYSLTQEPPGIAVDARSAQRLADGSVRAGASFDPARLTRRARPRFLTAEDVALLECLQTLPRNREAHVLVADKEAALLLPTLLATGRAFWDFDSVSSASPLRLGRSRSLSIAWLPDEYAVQTLSLVTDPVADIVLPSLPPWYLDLSAGESGPCDSPVAEACLQQILAEPVVAPCQVKPLRDALATTATGDALSLPRAYPIERLSPMPMVPVAILRGRPLAHLELRFDYGPVRLGCATPDTRLIEGRALTVTRDAAAENRAIEQLFEAGLVIDETPGVADDTAGWVPAREQSRQAAGAARQWIDFQLVVVPGLQQDGWRVESDDFPHRLFEPDTWDCRVESSDSDGWFDLALFVEVQGRRIDLLPVLVETLRKYPLPDIERGEIPDVAVTVPLGDHGGGLLCLPVQRILPLMQLLLELYGNAESPEAATPRLSRIQLARLSALTATDNATPFQWLGDRDARELIMRLRQLDDIPSVAAPDGLQAQLRPYQLQGIAWMQFLSEFGFGGILADDMGLGKTLQTLAHVLLERSRGNSDLPSLVVAPTSLVFNWLAEAQRFTPDLSVLVLHGPQRSRRFREISSYDLVLTSYPLLLRDSQSLARHAFYLVVFDEAQWLKNPAAKVSRAARQLNTRRRIGLTGTPMENHLGELWALFDLLMPGLLGERRQFARLFRAPIEKQDNSEVRERLSRRIRPFMLRRSKGEVVTELPEKTEMVQPITLAGEQRDLYETVRLSMHKRVREEIERQGLERSQIVVLDALLRLRQVCCDPRLIQAQNEQTVPSAKLARLMEMLPEMIEEGRRVLLFSQFTGMLKLIEEEVRSAGIGYSKLTGKTRKREAAVARFQERQVPLFLISLKAGGVGLNLTEADTVIHYDPWWNPAVERQATDRAHRIGQRKPVFVYKLICRGTLEERMQVMQERKRALADGIYTVQNGQGPQWSQADLDALFAPCGK